MWGWFTVTSSAFKHLKADCFLKKGHDYGEPRGWNDPLILLCGEEPAAAVGSLLCRASLGGESLNDVSLKAAEPRV